MREICIVTALFLLVFLVCPMVYADRGMIPIPPDISVYEPGQKAILAWNGYEEIMILSTDVTSSEETLVLEILPLPSEPVVEAASFQSFEEIQNLIWEEGVNQFLYSTKGDARSGSVEVVFHEKIGAHNITVVYASVTSELVSWIGDFLVENGVEEEISLQNFESVVEDYMNRGFRYYVLDLIIFLSEERSVDPILYHFDSSFLYYPLLITSPVEGDTEITLFLLSEGKIKENHLLMQKAEYGDGQPIEFVLSKGDLSKIDLRIGNMLQDGAWLSVLEYDGKIRWLTKDLMISESAINSDTINVEVTLPIILIVSCVLLGAVSALSGAILTFLITRSKKTKPS